MVLKQSKLKQIKDNNEELKRRLKLVQEKRDSYKFRYKDVSKKFKQRDEVIDEAISTIESWNFALSNAENNRLSIILEILQRYKGDNK